ncbi:MAG: hypothetical protein ACLRMJ_05725 [Alistipes finegoldii]
MTLTQASATWRPKTRTCSAGRYFNPLTSLYTCPRGESVEIR